MVARSARSRHEFSADQRTKSGNRRVTSSIFTKNLGLRWGFHQHESKNEHPDLSSRKRGSAHCGQRRWQANHGALQPLADWRRGQSRADSQYLLNTFIDGDEGITITTASPHSRRDKALTIPMRSGSGLTSFEKFAGSRGGPRERRSRGVDNPMPIRRDNRRDRLMGIKQADLR